MPIARPRRSGGNDGRQQRQAERHHECRSEALHAASRDQQSARGRERRPERARGEDREAEREHAPAAEAVAERGAGQQQRREGQGVGVHEPAELRDRCTEVGADARESIRDDEVVERDHEHGRSGDDERECSATAVGCGRGVHSHSFVIGRLLPNADSSNRLIPCQGMSERPARQTADERRTEITAAAAIEFARRGLDGATTDCIAERAGVSQPYVVRLFGTKKALFLAVANRAFERVAETFRAAAVGDSPGERLENMGAAYVALLAGPRRAGLAAAALRRRLRPRDPGLRGHALRAAARAVRRALGRRARAAARVHRPGHALQRRRRARHAADRVGRALGARAARRACGRRRRLGRRRRPRRPLLSSIREHGYRRDRSPSCRPEPVSAGGRDAARRARPGDRGSRVGQDARAHVAHRLPARARAARARTRCSRSRSRIAPRARCGTASISSSGPRAACG